MSSTVKNPLLTATLLISLLIPNQDAITQEPNNHLNKKLIAGGTIATGALASTIYFLYKANSYKKQLLKRPTLTIEEEIKFEKKLKLYKRLALTSGVIAIGGFGVGLWGAWRENGQKETQKEQTTPVEPDNNIPILSPEEIEGLRRSSSFCGEAPKQTPPSVSSDEEEEEEEEYVVHFVDGKKVRIPVEEQPPIKQTKSPPKKNIAEMLSRLSPEEQAELGLAFNGNKPTQRIIDFLRNIPLEEVNHNAKQKIEDILDESNT